MKEKDQGREGPTIAKLFQLFRLFLPSNTKTLARLKLFTDLDPKALSKKHNLQIKGIIIDVDDTIAPHLGQVLKKNFEHIQKLHKQGYKMVLYSNLKKNHRLNELEKFIPVLTNLPAKPDPAGFQIACKTLNLKPENIIMVGDNYITDAGSIRSGIPFVKVKPIKSHLKTWPNRIKLIPYGLIRDFYTAISRFHQLFEKKV